MSQLINRYEMVFQYLSCLFERINVDHSLLIPLIRLCLRIFHPDFGHLQVFQNKSLDLLLSLYKNDKGIKGILMDEAMSIFMANVSAGRAKQYLADKQGLVLINLETALILQLAQVLFFILI